MLQVGDHVDCKSLSYSIDRNDVDRVDHGVELRIEWHYQGVIEEINTDVEDVRQPVRYYRIGEYTWYSKDDLRLSHNPTID